MPLSKVLCLTVTAFLVSACPLRGEDKVYPRAEHPRRQLYVGETLTADIHYFKMPLGRAVSSVKEIVTLGDRQAYHIVLKVRSSRFVDWIYKVRDEHHSYVDVETLTTLKYEKNLEEGHVGSQEKMIRDFNGGHVTFENLKTHEKTVLEVPEDIQDPLSCGYWFRTISVAPEDEISIPVVTQNKKWRMNVKTYKVETLCLDDLGEFQAMEVEPAMDFAGIFVRKGKIRGWMSMDERRIPLRMKVKIPIFGNVVAEVVEYKSGEDNDQEV
ncbi:MAG: DUF3108 domain-containing protein [Candidatus Omnitrophica bacterium]|nr:DUF3108 domain-containing protein [Candidatus Omnitrophota bacterium]